MTDDIHIRRATLDDGTVEGLTDLLCDVVEGGASVGFMDPLSRAEASSFWHDVLASAERGERIVLVARDVATDRIAGTVQVVLAMPPNQPHRGSVLKLLVHRGARRRRVGARLMRAIEGEARDAGKTLLVLDTVTGSAAEHLYASLGWERCGVIPGYALWPTGGPCDTTVFYRRLGNVAATSP